MIMRALQADQKYKDGTAGKLEGLPIAVKDNIDVKHHYTTAGSKVNMIAPESSRVWRQLFAEGAICAGKTNMDEFGAGFQTIKKTWGTSKSALDPTRVAGGSSGGSAGTVGLNVVPCSLGTDTGGSLRIPAACNGVIGYRPTINRWPCDFALKISDTRDSVGPFATCMDDIALLDSVVTGVHHHKVPSLK